MSILTLTALVLVVAGLGVGIILTLRKGQLETQILGLLATFVPVVKQARSDPSVLLACYPTLTAARKCFPEAFSRLEGDGSEGFPFGRADIEIMHERWTAEWLEWEQTHESNCQRKIAAIDATLKGEVSEAKAVLLRTELQAVEQEKLDSYQRRYAEYVGISRALERLTESPTSQKKSG